jgi:glycosyltransferase involved in cell wall biosynthesis
VLPLNSQHLEAAPPLQTETSQPRVLVVSDTPFSEYHGAGVTMTTLFAGWPADRLAMFCSAWSPMVRMRSDHERCARVRSFRVPGPGGRLDWVKHRLGLLPNWCDDFSAAWHRRWFREWRPDVVYSMFLDLNTFRYADWLADLLDVPHICHITDDVTPGLPAFGLDRFRTRLTRAACRIAISEEMKQQYEALAGSEFLVFHNGATDFPHGVSTKARNDEMVIRYLGSVSVIQHAALIEVADAVHLANAAGVRCRLEVVGSFWEQGLDASFVDGVDVHRVGPYVPAEQWIDLMRSSDLLLIPVSFSTATSLDVRLSLPTKLLEYLSTGTPVLVYAPPDAAPARFCRRNALGSVVTEQGAAALARFIHDFASDPQALRRKGANDRVTVRHDFSNTSIASRFQRLLGNIAAGSPS